MPKIDAFSKNVYALHKTKFLFLRFLVEIAY